MKLSELKAFLASQPAANLRFLLPHGEKVPAHAHVTEVARVDKRFIDCGGTLRNESCCRLQIWLSDDVWHRLSAGKLARILEMAVPVLGPDDLDVDIEHEAGFISQFPLAAVDFIGGELVLQLTQRHTACLALDKCMPARARTSEFNPIKSDFKLTQPPAACCATTDHPI